MTEQLNKNAKIRAPHDGDTGADGTGSNTDYGIRKFAMNTTAQSAELPGEWAGQYVAVRPVGGGVEFAFSFRAAAVVNDGVVATNTGASANVGWPLVANEEVHRQLPFWDPKAGRKCYLLWQGDTNSTELYVGRV